MIYVYVDCRRWRDWVDKEILKMAGHEPNCSAALDETKQKNQNLEKELTKILRQLQEFKVKILPTDQNECKNTILVHFDKIKMLIKIVTVILNVNTNGFYNS